MKKGLTLSAAVVLAVSVAACGSSGGSGGSATPGVTSHQILIGAPQPLTGPFAFYGGYADAGIQAVFNEVNASGGIYGRKLKLLTADTQCTSGALAVSATRQLLDQDHVFEIGVTQCGVADAAIDQSVLKGTDIADLTNDGAGWTIPGPAPDPQKGSAYAYYYSPNTADQGLDGVAWAQKNFSPTPHLWGVIADDDLYGGNCAYGIEQFAKANGLPAPIVEQTADTATNESVNIAKIKSAGADSLALCTFPAPTTASLSAALAAGWHPSIMLDTYASAQVSYILPTLPKAAYAKTWGIESPLSPALGTPQLAAYIKHFQKYYPKFQPNDTEGSSMAEILVAYLKRAGKNPTRQSFLKGLYEGPVSVYGMAIPSQIKPGPHTEVINSVLIAKFPNPNFEQIIATQAPPSNVVIPGL